jgi:hypothetical protein
VTNTEEDRSTSVLSLVFKVLIIVLGLYMGRTRAGGMLKQSWSSCGLDDHYLGSGDTGSYWHREVVTA